MYQHDQDFDHYIRQDNASSIYAPTMVSDLRDASNHLFLMRPISCRYGSYFR